MGYQPMDLNNFLTVLEAADQCNLTPETIRRCIREKKLHAIKLGMMWYIPAQDLTQFQESRLVTGTEIDEGNGFLLVTRFGIIYMFHRNSINQLTLGHNMTWSAVVVVNSIIT